MLLPKLVFVIGVAGPTILGCDTDIVNGFATFGTAKLQGFVSRSDGSPVPDIQVGASFGPDAFGLTVQTDARGLYEFEAVSHQPLDEPPFDQGVIQCRISVAAGPADTLIPVRFVPTGETATPVTVNFVVDAP